MCWTHWSVPHEHARHAPPRRLAPAPARRRVAGRGAALQCGALCARHRDAEPRAAGHEHRGRPRLPRPHPRGTPAGGPVRAVDDALSDRHHARRRDRARPRERLRARLQALPGGRDHPFRGGRHRRAPHHFCRPVLQAEADRAALMEAVAGGSPRLFLGTDSAPHARAAKETACGCAGIFSAHAGIELYAEAFELAGALGRLEAFASAHGADFYGLPRSSATLTLVREPWEVPARYAFGPDELVPLRAGGRIAWRLAS